MRLLSTKRSKLTAVLVVLMALVALYFLVPWFYVEFIRDPAPPPLSFDDFGSLPAAPNP